jgi:hypothetical protein
MLILVGSLFGAAYFGYNGTTIYAVLVWAILCAIWFLVSQKDVLEIARTTAYGSNSSPNTGSRFTTFLIFVSIAAVLTGVQIGVYFIAAQFA